MEGERVLQESSEQRLSKRVQQCNMIRQKWSIVKLYKTRKEKILVGKWKHENKILEYNEPFKSRKEIETRLKRILDSMELGNWVRARYDAQLFSHRLNKTIEIIRKTGPDLEKNVVLSGSKNANRKNQKTKRRKGA